MLMGTALAVVPVGAAHAQSDGQNDEEPVRAEATEQSGDAIIVTGSRIRGVAPVGSNLIGIGSEDIVKSGASTVSEVLRQIPQITSLSINAEGATGAGASSNLTRATGPNLRGLGSNATLVVVDGERVPVSGTQGNFVDPSFLPSIAIGRIEVIADGASAIYGSDAVAGVVNLIPRKKYDGVEIRGRVGMADAYTEYQVSGIAGTSWSSGNIVVAAEYTRNDALLGTDRDFVSADRRAHGGADGRSTACSPGTLTVAGKSYAVPANSTGVLDFNNLVAGTVNRCDLTKPGFLIPKQERISLFGHMEQQLGETFSVFAQGYYSKRDFSGPIPGQYSVSNIVIPTTNPFYPINAPASPIAISTNFMDSIGLNQTRGTSESFLVNGGVRANLGKWEVKLAGSYGESSDEEDRDPSIHSPSLAAALAVTDPSKAINPFTSGTIDASLLRPFYVSLFNPAVTNRLKAVEMEANGPLFALPGGEVRMALGAEYREEHQFGAFTIGTVASPLSLPNNIKRNSKAVFSELFVPIVGESNAGPGMQRLELLAAIRYEDYSDFGGTTNPKVGLTWSPADGLALRGSYGTSFRAPGLAEIDPNSSGAGIRTNPITVPGQPLPLTMALLAAGNPNLKPETATTWSFGADLMPSAVPGLRLSATYFDVTYKGQVLDVFTIIPQVVAEPQNFSDILYFNDGSAHWQEGVNWLSNTQYYTPGSINFDLLDGIIDARKANLGKTLASGLDFEASYNFDMGENHFSLAGNATLYLNYKNSTGGGALQDRLGTYGYPQEFRGRASFGWERGPVSTQLTVNYLSSYQNLTSKLVQDVSSYTTVDLDIGYTFGEDAGPFAGGVRLGVNARNLFDRNPPFVDAGLGYDPSAASALGRMVSLSLSKEF
ncbi:MAG: hypothetical protein BGO57_08305 [Sphingomonadales bacterium 63-6]|nr:MAG: hypothetical protein BGO57_08305 [Sphingomonadales bacterium 63-6]